MARSPFIASLALHSGLLALVCGVALRGGTSRGPADSGLQWSANSEVAGELFAADPSETFFEGECNEQVPEQKLASMKPIQPSMDAAVTTAPLTTTASFSAVSALSVSALPSFAEDGISKAKTHSASGAARKASAKGNGSRNRAGAAGGQSYTPARYVFCPPPAFPTEARKARLSGTALVLVLIDARGRPLSVTLQHSSGHAILDTAALRAVRGWRFEPARRDSNPVDARLEIPVRFALS
jgi:protein TonB